MTKSTGFLRYDRINPEKLPVEHRIQNFKEFEILLPEEKLKEQAARCMDCGIPYCHSYGCPVNNRIPDWNNMVYHNQWKKALHLLHSTINFPEFTGRICPAPCESSCTLAINTSPVTIKHIELQIVEKGWEEGWIVPQISSVKTGRKVAIIGSGPAGLTAAQQLVRMGHEVVVFEKSDRIGGLLRYGIPDFKMEKSVIDRRLEQMKAEGVIFEPDVYVGTDLSPRYLKRTFDAVLITTGSSVPRNIDIPGRELGGIYFAMDYLTQQNKINAGDAVSDKTIINAKNKNVLVIGGGDTGSDCVGTAKRQGALEITQVEILPEPPIERSTYNPWPTWPKVFSATSSHEEGCRRIWSYSAKSFEGINGHVNKINFAGLEWSNPDKFGNRTSKEIHGQNFVVEADIVLLAMGFIHTEHGKLINDLNIDRDKRGNITVDNHLATSHNGFFAAGDSVLGASLVVRAINQGRTVAEGANHYLINL